jgi:hypothetical protein
VVCEERLLANRDPLTPKEAQELIAALTQAPDPAFTDAIIALLVAGKDRGPPRVALHRVRPPRAGMPQDR